MTTALRNGLVMTAVLVLIYELIYDFARLNVGAQVAALMLILLLVPANGFRYQPDKEFIDEDLEAILLGPLDVGARRIPSHTISGQWRGHPVTAFEYSDIGELGRSPLGVILWEFSGRALPRFVLAPEGFWHRLAEKFGAQNIDFADDPAFSRAYRLRGDEESAVRAPFTPTVRRFLSTHPGQRVAGSGRHLVWWVEGGLPKKPEALDAFLERGDAVRRVFSA